MASYPALDLRFPAPGAGPLEDLLYATLDAFEPLAIHDLDDGGWRVFFRLGAQRDAAGDALASALGGRLTGLDPVEVDDGDWARRSQATLTAIRAGRIVVAPPWDVPAGAGVKAVSGRRVDEAGPSAASDARAGDAAGPSDPGADTGGDILVVIEPSMGFGTGHHATTRLCLELLQAADLRGRSAIDVGTGSGVLALAAWRLGASVVTAIDNDPDALQNARENLERNGAAGAIEIIEGDLTALSGRRGDLVVANLTAAVLRRHADALRGLVAPGGRLIVSGFSPEEAAEVTAAFDLRVEDTRREGEWAAVQLGRGPAA